MEKALITPDPMPVPLRAHVKSHGVIGGLYVSLQRFAILGWLLFFITAVLFALFVFVDKLQSDPIAVVNEKNQLIGELEWVGENTRTDTQVLTGLSTWLRHYRSVNAKTIFEDYAAALSMMSGDLQAQTIDNAKKSQYLTNIANSGVRAWLEFTNQQLLSRKGNDLVAQFQGMLVIDNGIDKKELPFDTTVQATVSARTTAHPLGYIGLTVTQAQDN